ncbi:ABC transporter ATP-binding protein [Prochlorococcus marinus XMU1410]|uniref:ABC transporter ATP-binding protein n=1 Tax=Prochlorococcus marinus TaxID=1219 RepID=UPI001ADBF9F3|nr:ATP-binding cassette domain-containing protein [Prochlorococcus marinus]MBO8242344.1 ABC transporter ATP-binding protein [Prochlorococcus marinus XMU1410]MBW3053491.1 polysaccharide/polyol phosphate ABC transporter ATP-binding protein [Prochlorococcus marinus str. MU1410]
MIKLENISLQIPIFTNETRHLKKKIIKSVTGGILSRRSADVTLIDALLDINCKIDRGERIALIGHNGAGKSSFLKLVSKIYEPTKGSIVSDVNVFPMIRKGFLTNDALSGYVAAKAQYLIINKTEKGFGEFLEKVVEFSGIGDFIYLPINTYSEGMASRLLFTLLTSFQHECLALDEGFGAGDNDFYNKAEKRLDEFIKSAGTLIFASHSDKLLERYCRRGLVFSKGRIVFDGVLEDALNFYYEK